MSPLKKIRLGDLLLQHGLIDEAQLQEALAVQARAGGKLGHILVQQRAVREDDLLAFLCRQLQIQPVNLHEYPVDPQALKRLPESLARRFHALVLDTAGGKALVATSDPTDLIALDEIARLIHLPIQPLLARQQDILEAIDRYYLHTEQIVKLAERVEEELGSDTFDLHATSDAADLAAAPAVRLLQSLFEDAVHMRASDIHLEPDENQLRIRQRVDGMLDEHTLHEKHVAAALVSRLKLMAGLNISEKRLPQGGRFSIRVHEREIDVRLSTMPVQHGESVVMRLLDRSTGLLCLDELGMPPDLLARFRHCIHLPHGMVLVTGPTGSGKTTTLYAALSELNTAEKNIITAEDPVEYTLPRINQVQVHPDIGLSFASVLRTALRQDPDIILVGEIRDSETAEIALRAALTGHLLLSTLHTNGAIATASRLLDMGVEGYLVAAALRAVVAQRLVRRVCPDCATTAEIDASQREECQALLGVAPQAGAYRIGTGCPHCNHSGYRGRIGVYELLEMDHAMLQALQHGDSITFNQAAERAPGFRPFALCALDYAQQGITSLDEVLRITGTTY